MLTIILSKTGSSEVSEVGISMPHWNMYWRSPVVFRQTDFPPAFGPEIRRILLVGLSFTVTGTIALFSLAKALSSKGWRAFLRFISPSSEISGMPALKSSETWALATRKSISPRYSAELMSSGIYGLTKSLKAARILWISWASSARRVKISFSSSKISAGSTKAVFPVAEVS